MTSKEDLIEAVSHDMSLTAQQKVELIQKLQQDDFYQHLVHGALGATVGVSISKFMNLGKSSQILLGIAGFGVGRMLWDNKDSSALKYNEKNKTYEVEY